MSEEEGLKRRKKQLKIIRKKHKEKVLSLHQSLFAAFVDVIIIVVIIIYFLIDLFKKIFLLLLLLLFLN